MTALDDAIERFSRTTLSDDAPGLFDGTQNEGENKADRRTLQIAEASRPRDALLYDTAHLVGARVRLSNLWRRDNDDALAGKVATVVGEPIPYIVPLAGMTDVDNIYVKMLVPVLLDGSPQELAALERRRVPRDTLNLPGPGFSNGWPADGVANVCSKNLEFVCQRCGQPGRLQACTRCEFAKYWRPSRNSGDESGSLSITTCPQVLLARVPGLPFS